MAKYIDEPSHTFNEYLLIPGYSSAEAIPGERFFENAAREIQKGRAAENYDEYPDGIGDYAVGIGR